MSPRQFIIRLVGPTGCEINLRAVLGPNPVLLIESALCELAWFNFFFSTVRRGHDPNVCRMFWIRVTFIVLPIHSARDHPDVALVLGFGLRLLRARTNCRRAWRLRPARLPLRLF